MSTDIPGARKQLKTLSKTIRRVAHKLRTELGEETLALGLLHESDMLEELIENKLTRKIRHGNSRTVNRKVTGWHVREVWRIKREWPSATYQEIAQRVGIGAGRVSEIINGLRTEASPGMKGDGLNRVLNENRE